LFKLKHINISNIAMKQKKDNLSGSSDTKTDFTIEKKLSEEEFFDGIYMAERGPFYSVPESQNKFEEWLQEREKKS